MKGKAYILFVEDDDNLAFVVQDNLELAGYKVKRASNGEHGWEVFQKEQFDLCLLDVMLPRKDGFSLAGEIRNSNSQVPIIFLTARNQKEDRIYGFHKGGDDYLVKPFSMEELILRIEVFMRRSSKVEKEGRSTYQIGGYVLNLSSMMLEHSDTKRKLTIREAELLGILAAHMGEIVRRDAILKELWGDDDYFMGRSLDVFISRLRKYLSEDPSIRIENAHSLGFRLIVGE